MRLYDTIYTMKYILPVILLLLSFSMANDTYLKQIKVIDRCTYLLEPLTFKSLGLKGINLKDFEAQKAIRACEKSLEEHPDDAHVQFLLARAYTKGTSVKSKMSIPKSVRLLIPELNDVLPQYEKGYYLAKKSCQSGDLGGCDLLAFYSHKGLTPSKYSSKKAFLLWFWSCNKGNLKACQNLSGILERGNYVPKDLKADYLYSLEACKSTHYPRACEVLEDQFSLRNYPLDEATQEYVFYNACISGSSNGCYRLEQFLKEHNITDSKKKYHDAIKKSCNSGSAKSCQLLAQIYAKLPKNRVNNILASTFFEDGCKNGAERFSCWYAGHYRVYPKEGIELDIDLGISQWEKSCYIGKNAFACYDLAQFFIYTDNMKYKNKKNAIKPLERACGYGNGYAEVLGCEQGIKSCCKQFK